MSSHESTGKTVEEAISAGLEQLGLSIGDVTVDILEEGSKGLFGLFGSRLAKVRLTVRDEEPLRDTRSLFADALGKGPTEEPEQRNRPGRPPEQRPREEKAGEGSGRTPKPREDAGKGKKSPKPPPRAESGPREARPKADPPRGDRPAAREKAKEKKDAKPQPARGRPAQDTPAPTEQELSEASELALKFLTELTRLMGVEASVTVAADEEGNLRASMAGDVRGVLIGRRGETLDALQYLTSLHVNRGRDAYVRITLDSEGYRAKREEALVRLATRMANRAQKTGRSVAMEPMNPYERRILHSALQGHPGVTTHSEGEEPNRHVVITLNRETRGKNGDDQD